MTYSGNDSRKWFNDLKRIMFGDKSTKKSIILSSHDLEFWALQGDDLSGQKDIHIGAKMSLVSLILFYHTPLPPEH